jgi:1-acyl-sn-glycerol-3-phosphate acyltransferase
MRNGLAMMVFPEGTTSDGKKGLLPFKSTAFQAAIDAEKAVFPVIISYAPEIRPEVQWCGDRSFLRHIWGLLGLKEARATVYIMKSEPVEPCRDRKELAARIYSVMNEKWRNL